MLTSQGKVCFLRCNWHPIWDPVLPVWSAAVSKHRGQIFTGFSPCLFLLLYLWLPDVHYLPVILSCLSLLGLFVSCHSERNHEGVVFLSLPLITTSIAHPDPSRPRKTLYSNIGLFTRSSMCCRSYIKPSVNQKARVPENVARSTADGCDSMLLDENQTR